MNNISKNLQNVADTIEQDSKTKKMKESFLLLKQKMCKTHDLIKQYTENMREIGCLKSDLEVAKKEAKTMISNYKSAMDKTRELELKIVDDKEKNEKLINRINEYEVNIAADKQTIQQLTCKIKELGEEYSAKIIEYDLQKSCFEDKIKDLEYELKRLKSTLMHKKKEKKIISTNFDTEIKSSLDVGINVALCDNGLNAKPEVQDKSIMTDEFYNTTDDPYPLFCAKCEAHLPPALTPEKICKTMSEYPRLIEKDLLLSLKQISSPMCLLPNTSPDSINRTEDIVLSRVSTPHRSPHNQYNNSIIKSPMSQSEQSSVTTHCKNIELQNVNVAAHIPDITNLSNNFDSIPATFTLSADMDYMRKDSCSDDLLVKHSIKEMERKIQFLESKMKKFRRLKKKLSTNSCCHRCVMNCDNNTVLNSDLLSAIYKGVANYYDEKRKMCCKSKRNIDSEKCNCTTKKVKLKKREQFNKYNECEDVFSWRIENHNEEYLRDKLCNKSKNVADILQSEHELCINKNFLISDVNTFSKALNDTDEFDGREFVPHRENILHSAEARFVANNPMTAHLDTDKIYTNNNLLSGEDMCVESINTDNQIRMKTTYLSTDKNPVDHVDCKVVHINAEEKIKSQSKDKIGDRLLKKMRNLKKKTQINMHINKQENIESCSDHSSKHLALVKKVQIENKNDIGDHSVKIIRNLKRKPIDNLFIDKYKDIESDHYELVKKSRIAHIPKTSVLQSSVITENITHHMIKNIASVQMSQEKRNGNEQLATQIQKDNLAENEKNYTISKKCDEKNTTECIKIKGVDKPINEKNLVSIDEGCLQNDNIILSAVDTEPICTCVSEFDKCDDILFEDTTNGNIPMERVMIKMSNNYNKPGVLYNNISHNIREGLEHTKSNPLKTDLIHTQIESSVTCDDSKYHKFKNSQIKTLESREEIMLNAELELQYVYDTIGEKSYNDNAMPKNMYADDQPISNKSAILEITQCKSHNNRDVSDKTFEVQHLPKDGRIIEDCVNDSNVGISFNEIKNIISEQKKAHINNEVTEIRSIKTLKENVHTSQQDKKTESIDFYDNDKNLQMPISQLMKYINKKHIGRKLPYKKMKYVCTIADKFVKKQLQRLTKSTWEDMSVHDDVMQKLENTCGPRIIAKCIVEFLLDTNCNEALDRSFTPPAPLMTTFEQKVTALLVDLAVSKPTIIYFVQAAIEYQLFRLNNEIKIQVDLLTRMYVVLSRIQKDREKVRMMCCNAFYCMGLKSINVLYTVLTCWPEVLPNADINIGILPKCITVLIGSQQLESTHPRWTINKLNSLKTLISTFYKYTYAETAISDIIKEFIIALKAKHTDGLDTAIILIAKREGSSWTYKNIIQSTLLPMIVNYQHPCTYKAFSLLGRLMRAFPLEDKDNIVQEISEQLCDLIESGEGSHDQQEGIISALLSLSRQKFNIVAPSVIKWMPNKSLRPTVVAQLQGFINTRNPKFWKDFLRRKQINILEIKRDTPELND